MPKKHFEAIAAKINARIQDARYMYDLDAIGALLGVARDMADVFADANPRFDRDRFLEACSKAEVKV